MASHCEQNSDDFGSAGQMLHGVSENLCTEENCSSLSNEVDTNQCISNVPIVPNDMVPLCGDTDLKPEMSGDGTSEVGLDSANQYNDFEVVKQTLADICDKIGRIDGSDTNTNGINGKQGDSSLPVAPEDMMSSAKFGRADNRIGCVTANDDLHGNLNIMNVENSDSEQCSNDIEEKNSQNNNQEMLVEKDIKPEITSDCCHSNIEQYKNTEVLESCNSNNNAETTVQKDIKDKFQYSCCQHLVSNNQSPNKQSVPNEQNVKIEQTRQRQPSVTNEHNLAASQTNTISDDLLHVLSVVQEDMRVLGLSTCTTKGRQLLTNGQEKEATSTDESDSSEDSSSSSSESLSDDSESEDNGHMARSHMAEQEKSYPAGPHQTRGELSFADLPHVDALDLCVDESVEITPLGEIESILSEDALVIIKSFEGVPAVDADSILFLENRLGFGKVFEIFGQVLSPHYCVRFNNEDEIKSTNIEIGQTVYFAPDTKDLTNFVFVSQLNSIRGTDASWKHDQEPPAGLVEYSDDEAESHAKAERKRAYQLKKRNQAHMQEQGTTEAATSSKKQRPCKPCRKKPETKPTPRHLLILSANQQSDSSVTAPQQQTGQQLVYPAPSQEGGFVPPPHQQPGQLVPPDQKPPLRIPPPSLRIPPSNPRGPPSQLDGQHQPFPPPLMGPPLHQPNLPCPPRFQGGPLIGPPLRNFIMPQGPPHFGPPPQNDGMFRPPFQNFAQPPPPRQQNWDGRPQPWMAGNNGPPNRPPMNEHRWPIGQPHTMVQERPPSYIKQEFPQNVMMGPQNLGSQPWMSGGHAFPNGPPMNAHCWPTQQQHVPRTPYIKQEPPPDVQKYLDM